MSLFADLQSIRDVAELEDVLSHPPPCAVEAMRAVEGDIVVLGVGGKMGPTLARMAKRASDQAGTPRRVIGVSRFSEEGLPQRLQSWGIETQRADLLDHECYADLPDAPNVMYMAGLKFGTTGNEGATWAMNTFLPGLVADRYRSSRIAVFSTGNVYGLTSVTSGGAKEDDPLCPAGEYAMSCLGRERVFDYFSRSRGIPMTFLRLCYATELRYGVLVDIGRQVYSGQTISVNMGYMNAIWQANASAMCLASLRYASSPPLALNVTGPKIFSVRRIAEEFGRLFRRPVLFEGSESPDALLANADMACRLFGCEDIDAARSLPLVAEWIERGGKNFGKPTHYDNRIGDF